MARPAVAICTTTIARRMPLENITIFDTFKRKVQLTAEDAE
jgi:hypothetical protein